MSDVLKYSVIEGAVSESGGLSPSLPPSVPYGSTRIRMMNEATGKTVALCTSKMYQMCCGKSSINVLLLNVICNIFFLTPREFDR